MISGTQTHPVKEGSTDDIERLRIVYGIVDTTAGRLQMGWIACRQY